MRQRAARCAQLLPQICNLRLPVGQLRVRFIQSGLQAGYLPVQLGAFIICKRRRWRRRCGCSFVRRHQLFGEFTALILQALHLRLQPRSLLWRRAFVAGPGQPVGQHLDLLCRRHHRFKQALIIFAVSQRLGRRGGQCP